jgi:hypothetical protein
VSVIDYYPPGPIAADFLADPAFVAAIKGPIGSGKSVTCVMKLMRIAYAQPISAIDGKRHARFAVIRNTYPELKTTTIKTWHAWIPADVGHWRDEGPPCHHIVTDTLDVEVLFVALDRPADVRKLLSLELTAAWINEAREVPKAILDGLTGRVGRFPEAKHGGCPAPQILMDTNPPDTDHWWYTLAENDDSAPGAAQLLESLHEAEQQLRDAGILGAEQKLFSFHAQPGGLELDAENQEGLSHMPGGRLGYYTRAKAGKTKDWINVYVHGNYGFVQDGKAVYPEFDDGLHIRSCTYNPRLPVYIGVDFGLTPAAVLSQRDMLGRVFVFDELCTGDMGAKRFGRMLRAKLDDYGIKEATITGDPAGDQRSQANEEETPFLMLKAEGLDIKPAHTNDFNLRREAVVAPMERLIDGRPGLTIDPRCKILRKGMAGAYHLKRVQVVGQERFQDKPDKGIYSHVCEALQYDVLGMGEGKALVKRPSNPNRSRSQYAQTD